MAAAALAGTGQGEDAATLDAPVRAGWRKQAVEWLRADLAHWSTVSRSGDPVGRVDMLQSLTHWRTDPDLTGIRDAAGLDALPTSERDNCKKLWQEVATLLNNANQTPAQPRQ